MNTEGRLTRNRARTTGTPLVKPLDSELRPRSSRLRKEFGTPMPRAALFDRTNECSETVDKEDGGSLCESVTVNTDTETCASEGTLININDAVESKATDIPFEDNIVKQLLDEYTSTQENLEMEMGITPLRNQPITAACEESSAVKSDTTTLQPADDIAPKIESQHSIHEEMLITPQRIEVAPDQAPAHVASDDAPVLKAEDNDGPAEAGVPAVELENTALHATEVSARKEGTMSTAMLSQVDNDRWMMDGSPYVTDNVHMVKTQAAAPSQNIKSVVKPTTPYDPRSLRQMKQELQAAAKIKAVAGLPCDSEASDTTQYTGAVCAAEAEESEEASSELCKALDDLLIAPKGASKEPLRGIPVAAGRHMRFTEEGEAVESPSVDRTLLRGFPAPAGSHLRFDD
ncbi:g8176 [Coccomyxa elongata]